MNDSHFTSSELFPFSALLVLIVYILISNYSAGYETTWSPLTIIAIIFAYYCLLGPFQAVTTGDTYDRLVNMREFYVSAFWGAFVFVVSFFVGYRANKGRGKSIKVPAAFSSPLLSRYGKKLFIVGFILFTVWTGGQVTNLLNPLDAKSVDETGGAIANYFSLSLNFLIPATALLFGYYMSTRKGLWIFIVCFLIALALSISVGFRYRIVLLCGPIAVIYYLSRGRRPNLVLVAVALFVFITLMGVINLSRQYGHGLDVSKLDEENTEGYYESGLREALIFQTSGAVIDLVPERHPHAGFDPIIATILFPIPSALYKEKQSGRYFFDMLDAIYGQFRQGAFFMSYAEYYLAFGWLGIIGGGLLLGWYSKKLWNWYLANHHNPLAIVLYSVTVTYLYVVISRGYLPQVTMLFFFSVFPVYVIFWLIKRRYKREYSLKRMFQPVNASRSPRQQP